MDEQFVKAAIFAVGLAVLVIWRAGVLADRLEQSDTRGSGSNYGLYFWGALILLGGTTAWVLFSRFAAGH
jgi:hypothetical protein